MRRRHIVLLGLIVLLVVVPLGIAWRTVRTEAGLQWALSQLGHVPGVRIEASGAHGSLAGPLAIDKLVIDHDAVRIEARGVRLNVRLPLIFTGNVQLEQASVEQLDVVLKTREEQPPSQPHFLPQFLEIGAPDVRLAEVSLTLADGRRFAASSVRAALAMTRWRIDLTDVAVEDAAGRIDGALTLRATLPLGLRGSANGHWRLPDERVYRFAAAARGNLDRLATTVTLADPASLSFNGTALTLTGTPRIVGTLRVTDFDGAPWLEAGQWPRVDGSVALDASASSFGLDGTLATDAIGDGPLRVQGAGHWRDGTLEIAALRAWLPRSTLDLRVNGTVKFAGNAPELALDGEWTALRWPLTGAATVESALGALSLHGALPYAFEIQAHARAPALADAPDARFAASGSIDREQLVVDAFDGDVLHGRLSGGGRVSWAGEQPWSAKLEARELDIELVRPDLPGRVSAVATVAGKGFSPDAPWEANLASLSGNVRGRALTGHGAISHREGSYELRDVRVANGPSHIEVNGRWGDTVDLRWNADVRSLAVLHPDFTGEFVSSGHAGGSAARPQLAGELRARHLGVGPLTAQALDVEIDLDATDARPSRALARATDVGVGPVRIDAVQFDAGGRSGEHQLALEFSATGDTPQRLPAFRGRIAARGAYDAARRSWHGLLDEAQATFPDGRASLLQPAAITAGADGLDVAPVCLQTGEARLCVEGEQRTQPDAWRVIYSAQDWPLKRLLRSLFGWKEFDGRLQAAGWLSQEGEQDWVGGMTLLIDQPTLEIPRNKYRSERIELGSGRLDVFAEPAELRATLELNMAESTRVHGELVATRDQALEPADYPLSGSIRGESSAINAMNVLVPEIDRSDGHLDARVAIAGTLGAPTFDGEFHVRDGRFDFYRTNLMLSEVTLDGRFVGDELVFDGKGKTTRGEIAIDGRFSWPEDVMTGEMHLKGERLMLADTPDYRILASPDLTLHAGADGYRVSGSVAIPQARITPRDLSTTVGTSPDERLVGEEEEETGPSTLERVRARVRVELGDDVRVSSYGLRAQLGGAVTVLSRPGDVVRGNGSIRVVEGEYKAFGQFVKIKRGVLSYSRAPLDDPSLDLVGERAIKAEDVVVAINVRGTLSEPFITLSSVPALPQAEALSYLLTGRSINTLQSGEAASVDRAAEDLAISGGGLLLGGLGTRFGLDEVAVERSGDEDTSVVLGKYLSPKLFVSYGISIVEAINTVKLRYTLNEHWSLKAEAGLEQSGDVEYKIER